jgi:hypothetical protein
MGLSQIENELRNFNLLSNQFYQLRKKSQKRITNWGSQELWKIPLHWAFICMCVLIVSKLLYLGNLVWKNNSWQSMLLASAEETLKSKDPNAIKNVMLTACQIERKNGNLCGAELLPMLNHLDGLLESLPPDSLMGISYSNEGLIFELASNVNPQLLIANPIIKNYSIQRLSTNQFILRPFAGLGVDTK